jgi:hypothetical protein
VTVRIPAVTRTLFEGRAAVRRPTRREAVLAGTFATLVAVLILWFPGCGPVGTSTEATGNGTVRASLSFTIRGGISRAISPGEAVALDLTLHNTNDLDLLIEQITVAVARVDAPQADAAHPCSEADFEVRPSSGGIVLRLPGNTTDRLSELDLPEENWPTVGMINRPVNQDGCKGASLTLDYEASGVEVQR